MRCAGGRSEARGDFWTWREQMYAVAERLDPDSYRELALAVYREMAASGVTAVGEFHYLHHQPDGTPYTDRNVMGRALHDAATEAGIRLTLLDTVYLASGIGAEPQGVQRRFSDGDAERLGRAADARHRRRRSTRSGRCRRNSWRPSSPRPRADRSTCT